MTTAQRRMCLLALEAFSMVAADVELCLLAFRHPDWLELHPVVSKGIFVCTLEIQNELRGSMQTDFRIL